MMASDENNQPTDNNSTTNTEDYDEEDSILTAGEFLDQQRALEEDAADKYCYKTDKCSYDAGNVSQMVYACRTCNITDEQGKPFGFCYACMIMCHTDHDVLELFHKRRFRCDCRTSRSPHACALQQTNRTFNLSNIQSRTGIKRKHPEESTVDGDDNGNSYNHNYWGRFCWCDDLYDENAEDQTMFQCIVCQDWFHEQCIRQRSELPDPETFDDFICLTCVEKHSLLKQITVCTPHSHVQGAELAMNECTLPKPSNRFLKAEWSKSVCKCIECLQQLREQDLMFLVEDQPEWMPELDDSADRSLYDSGMDMLNRMDRVQAIEGARAVQELQSKLKPFLGGFAHDGRVVTKADIEHFFAELRDRKQE